MSEALKGPRIARRHTSYDSYASDVDWREIFGSGLPRPPTPPPHTTEDCGWSDSSSLHNLWYDDRKPALAAQYANCLTRMDFLNHLWDCEQLKPKTYLKPVTEWPPQDYDSTFRPPELDKLATPFSVSSDPDFLSEAYQAMIATSKEYLELPFNDDQVTKWIEKQAVRLGDVQGTAIGWLDYDDVAVHIDKDMYKSLSFFSGVIPLPVDIRNISGTRLSIESDRRDWVLLAEGERKTSSCLIRFLHMTWLDVCEEIQDIATQSPGIVLKDGKPQWPSFKQWTPPHGKAQSILEWVLHASRPDKTMYQGSCNYVKLGDGWKTIWFLVENDHIKVGPTMTPSQRDTSAPVQDAPFGLVHAFLGCAAMAGKKHHDERLKLKAGVQKGVAYGTTKSTKFAEMMTTTAALQTQHSDAIKPFEPLGTDQSDSTLPLLRGLLLAEAKRRKKLPIAGSSRTHSPVRKSIRKRYTVHRLASDGSEMMRELHAS